MRRVHGQCLLVVGLRVTLCLTYYQCSTKTARSGILFRRRVESVEVRWAALPQLVRDIGPIFGLVSFGVFLSLLVLYIVRAREIRKLRREAPFLAESNGNPES